MYCTHCAKDFLIVKKNQPNLIPSKIIPMIWVHLNSKIKFAICHWTWKIGYRWHLQRKSGCFVSTNIWLLDAIVDIFQEVARTSSKKPWFYLARPEFCHQIFLKSAKFNLSPKSNDKLQIFFLEFKSTHPMGIIFDGIRFGWIFSLLKDLFYNVQRNEACFFYIATNANNSFSLQCSKENQKSTILWKFSRFKELV